MCTPSPAPVAVARKSCDRFWLRCSLAQKMLSMMVLRIVSLTALNTNSVGGRNRPTRHNTREATRTQYTTHDTHGCERDRAMMECREGRQTDVLCVDGAREVSVDDVGRRVHLQKPAPDELRRRLEVGSTCTRGGDTNNQFPEIWSVCARGACCCAVHGVRTIVAGEGALEVDLLDLLLEEIDLVEEENERSLGEPWAVANLIKQQQRLCSHAQPKAHSISTHRYAPHTHTHTQHTRTHTTHTIHAHTHTHTTHATNECASKYPLFDSGCRPREASDRTRRGPRRR
jgi:hypothetical protein